MKIGAVRSLPWIGLVVAGCTMGCASIPVHMHTESHIQHLDGTSEHKSSDWEGTLDQLPAQLSKAGAELGAVTSQMVKELTDVPPPGTVELKDISPGLARYQGKRHYDFLTAAKDDAGKPITFTYVRLGVREFDEFFKTAQEIYALIFETTQVVGQLRKDSAKLLDTKVDASAELKATVDKAIGAGGEDAELTGRVKKLADVATILGTLIPQLVSKVGKLVQTGEALVASAATTLTNPKVLAHLDLVKTGLVDSVKVIKESGGTLVAFSKDLTNFKA